MSALPRDAAVVAEHLHLASGFLATERGWVSERLAELGPRLRRFSDDQIDLEVSVTDRQGTAQRVTLACWINRSPRLNFVVSSSARDLPEALTEVGDELSRQVREAETHTGRRGTRALRLVPRLPE